MPFNSAQEAFEEFQRTGAYANSAKHFGGDQAMFGEYKQMIPQETKRAFKQKVAGNEQRAIQGLQAGNSREGMGIYNIPEQGQALWRRLGMGLGTGLDMNKAYDFGGGTAREIGTTDMAKFGTTRGITDVERQRWADFQAAGSPENYWRNFRQSQIQDLVNRGAIAKDPNGGYYNPGQYGQAGQHYGANLEGYNMGANNPGGAVMGGSGGSAPRPNASYGAPSYSSPFSGGPSGSSNPLSYAFPSGGNTGVTGGSNFGVQPAPQGFAPSGGAPQLSYKGVSGGGPSPLSFMPPPTGQPSPGGAPSGNAVPNPGGSIFELPPGNAGIPMGMGQNGTGGSPFPGNPVPLPTGNGIVGLPGNGNGTGGAGTPPLPGFEMPPMGVNPWDPNSPWGNSLMNRAGMDASGQGFVLDRAQQEYLRSLPKESYLTQLYGQVLGIDPTTGQQLTGAAANAADRQSFGLLAPEANRLAGDMDAALERLRSEVPTGGAQSSAAGDIVRAGQSGMLGMRQNLQQNALGGLTDLMRMQKGFDPSIGNSAEAMLGADVSTRGQDLSTLLGARGQDLESLLGQRGQDVNWGLGWGNIGNSQMMNLWDSYLRGRGQDMDLYSQLRGQDLQRQMAMQQSRDQAAGRRSNFWGGLLGTVGGLAGTLLAPGIGTALGAGIGSRIGGGIGNNPASSQARGVDPWF